MPDELIASGALRELGLLRDLPDGEERVSRFTIDFTRPPMFQHPWQPVASAPTLAEARAIVADHMDSDTSEYIYRIEECTPAGYYGLLRSDK